MYSADSQLKITKLKHKLEKRDAKIADLESVVQRQMAMLDRYDRASTKLAASQPAPARQFSSEEYGRLIELLDRAILRAEQLTQDKRMLETNLERALNLLDQALSTQEKIASRMETGSTAISAPKEDQIPASFETTLSRYDTLLERSLTALESAYRASEAQRSEIAMRDQYLNRTLEALQGALSLKEEAAGSGRRDMGDSPGQEENVQAALSRYDGMLERSLEALEKAYRQDQDSKKQIQERDRLLSRTLDALQNMVEAESQMEAGSRPTVLSRLFG